MFNTNQAVNFAIILLLLSAVIIPFWQKVNTGTIINATSGEFERDWTKIGISGATFSGILIIAFVIMFLKGKKED